MVRLSRKLYKRRHSWEATIPMPLISLLDRSKKWDVLYKYDNKVKKWFLSFSEHKKVKKDENKAIRRHIYVRGSSFASTIPLPLMLGLDLNKRLAAKFEFDSRTQQWFLEVQNE